MGVVMMELFSLVGKAPRTHNGFHCMKHTTIHLPLTIPFLSYFSQFLPQI